jgi:hypothetical protein
MLILVAVLIIVVALLNIFQTERPTISETENRVLATWPEWKIEDVVSGKYFADVMAFFSDTFYGRETLVSLSKKMDQLKGYFDDDDFSVIIDPNATQPPPTEDDTIPTLPPLPTLPPVPTTVPTEPTTLPTEPTGPTAPTAPTTEPTEPTMPPVIPVILSDSTASLTVGAAHTLTATVGEGYVNLKWTSDKEDIAFVTDNGNGTATVKALAAGTAAISATVTGGDGEETTCVCIFTITQPNIERPDEVADFLPSGMFIYKGAAYSQSHYSKTYAPKFAELYDYYAKLFPNTRISVLPAPLATITIQDPEVLKKISDQGETLDKMEALIFGNVNFINTKNIYLAHADEYLYYKSDHHWTHRGAYYAYYEFARSLGMTPTPIDEFELKILTDKYIGSMYNYTGDERVKSFYDTVEAYIPTKKCTMTIHGTEWGTIRRDFCIATNYKNYLAFLMGDNGYTVINVPENPQDMTILVIKDSYGNALVPYLTEHYGNIIVIDPRHVSLKLLEEFKDMNLTDILFATNTTSANTKAWYNYYYNMIS